MPGEFELIDWIRQQHQAGGPSPLVRVGPGDDLAVLDWPGDDLLVVGVDQVLDGVHFDSSRHAPRLIGRKVMNRNLSDCAAMACLPAAAVATVALPKGTPMADARELYAGLREAGEAFGCVIVGGDTATWPGKLVVTVTVLGRSAGIEPVTRKGARPGDGLYVTGPLGGSLLGRHMTFTPRVREARQLAQAGTVTAMIDVSDGLSRDLRHICAQSGVGARVEASLVPIHDDAVTRGEQTGRTPLDHALHDGEDHELLLTASADPGAPAVRIGAVTAAREIVIVSPEGTVPLEPKGWEHAL